MKRIYILIFGLLIIMKMDAEIITVDTLKYLLPLPENPNLVGYCTELKEALLLNLNEDNFGYAGVDFRMNGQEAEGFFLAGQLGISVKLGNYLLQIPFLGGMTHMFNPMEDFLEEDMWKNIPPQGLFLSGGLFFSGRYGHLGLMYDWFNVGGDNRYIQGDYSSVKFYARNIASEIPYIGNFLMMIEGFFSIDQFIESFSTDTGLNDFKPEYEVSMLSRGIPLGKKASINFAAFSMTDWYDRYSKFDMQGGKIYLSYGTEEKTFVFFSDIAYRKFFDIIIQQRYSEYEDGIYLKFGALFLSRDDDLTSYIQLYAESGKGPLFSGVKIGLLAGLSVDGFASIKITGTHSSPNYSTIPVNGAISLRMEY